MKRKIFGDWFRTMAPAALSDAAAAILGEWVVYASALVLDEVTQAILSQNQTMLALQLRNLGLLLVVGVLLLPVFRLFTVRILLVRGFRHDNVQLNRFLHKSWMEVVQLTGSDLEVRLEWDLSQLRLKQNQLVKNLFVLLIVFVLLIRGFWGYPAVFVLFVLGMTLLRFGFHYWKEKHLSELYGQYLNYNEQVNQNILELSTRALVLRLQLWGSAFFQRWERQKEHLFQSGQSRRVGLRSWKRQLQEVLDFLVPIGMLILGSVLIAKGKMRPGDLASALVLQTLFSHAFEAFREGITDVRELQPIYDRLTFFYTGMEQPGAVSLEANRSISIVIEGLSYRYPGAEQPVFENWSGQLQSGDRIWISGPNGCGKSTLLRILCGFLTDYTGSIRINGRELRNLELDSWRRCFAMVEQEPAIFSCSLEENILLGREIAPQKIVDYQPLWRGKSSECVTAGNGISCSGGEERRIALARGVIGGERILILDEPLNHLDSDCVLWLQEYVRAFEGTVLLISHDERLQSLATAEWRLG